MSAACPNTLRVDYINIFKSSHIVDFRFLKISLLFEIVPSVLKFYKNWLKIDAKLPNNVDSFQKCLVNSNVKYL